MNKIHILFAFVISTIVEKMHNKEFKTFIKNKIENLIHLNNLYEINLITITNMIKHDMKKQLIKSKQMINKTKTSTKTQFETDYKEKIHNYNTNDINKQSESFNNIALVVLGIYLVITILIAVILYQMFSLYIVIVDNIIMNFQIESPIFDAVNLLGVKTKISLQQNQTVEYYQLSIGSVDYIDYLIIVVYSVLNKYKNDQIIYNKIFSEIVEEKKKRKLQFFR